MKETHIAIAIVFIVGVILKLFMEVQPKEKEAAVYGAIGEGAMLAAVFSHLALACHS